jgi:hypothetical protein
MKSQTGGNFDRCMIGGGTLLLQIIKTVNNFSGNIEGNRFANFDRCPAAVPVNSDHCRLDALARRCNTNPGKPTDSIRQLTTFPRKK